MGGRIAVSETLHNDCTTCFDACSLNRHADFATAGSTALGFMHDGQSRIAGFVSELLRIAMELRIALPNGWSNCGQ